MDRIHLLMEADELADLILQTPEVQAYRQAESALETNGEAKSLLRRLHELREQVAEFQARRVPPMHYSYLLEETDKLMEQLNTIPVVKTFEEAQEKMNALLDTVTSALANAVNERKIDDDIKPE